jgi:hypothetical protein
MTRTSLEDNRAAGRLSSRMLTLFANMTLIYPLIVLGMLYGEWLLAWFVLGHKPSIIGDDDPELIPTRWLHGITWIVVLGILPVGCAAIIFNVAHIIRNRPSAVRAAIRLHTLVCLWLGMYSMLDWYDPYQVMEWWLD